MLIYRISFEEAIERISSMIDYVEITEKGKYALTMAKQSLEKQIPKKPTPHIVNVERLKIGNVRWGKGTTVYKCPCCNNFVSRVYDYCFKCGQAFDWSDTE